MDNKALTDPFEGYDLKCSICEDGNGGQICESCSRLVDGFKRWITSTDQLPKATTRFIITHKNLRHGNFLPIHTIFYNDRESAQSHLNTLGEDGNLYDVREIEIAYKD